MWRRLSDLTAGNKAALASRAPAADTLDWLLGGALVFAPVALAGSLVFGLLAFELRPVLLGWLLLPLGAHVGCALEACLPEHPRP